MHMSLSTLYRAALLHLTISPLARVSATATNHHLLQSPNRPFTLLNQCPSLYHYNTTIHSYSTSTMPDSQTDPKPQEPQQEQTPKQQQQQTYLALPDAATASATNKLDLSSGSDTMKLDHLGPLVVNTDGTLARISNWEHMTEAEQKTTLRVLGKRNKQRLEALKVKEGEGESKE